MTYRPDTGPLHKGSRACHPSRASTLTALGRAAKRMRTDHPSPLICPCGVGELPLDPFYGSGGMLSWDDLPPAASPEI